MIKINLCNLPTCTIWLFQSRFKFFQAKPDLALLSPKLILNSMHNENLNLKIEY